MKAPKPIDLIRAALEKQKRGIGVEFDLPTDPPLRVIMAAPDLFTLWQEQEIVYQRELAQRKAAGDDKFPINKDQWEREFREAGPEMQAIMMREKPQNLAEQIAQRTSRFKTIIELLPKCLRDAETGEPLCQTPEDEHALKAFLTSDPAILGLVTEKYAELARRVQSTLDAAKNSPGGDGSENGQ